MMQQFFVFPQPVAAATTARTSRGSQPKVHLQTPSFPATQITPVPTTRTKTIRTFPMSSSTTSNKSNFPPPAGVPGRAAGPQAKLHPSIRLLRVPLVPQVLLALRILLAYHHNRHRFHAPLPLGKVVGNRQPAAVSSGSMAYSPCTSPPASPRPRPVSCLFFFAVAPQSLCPCFVAKTKILHIFTSSHLFILSRHSVVCCVVRRFDRVARFVPAVVFFSIFIRPVLEIALFSFLGPRNLMFLSSRGGKDGGLLSLLCCLENDRSTD